MVTYKVLLEERRIKSDGTYPVIIRITCNRQVCTINSGASIQKEYWDIKSANVKSSHANAQLINRKVTEFYLKIQKVVLELEGEDLFDFDLLKERLNSDPKPTKPVRTATFKDYTQRLIRSMLEINKAGNAIIYQTATNRLLAYANNPNIKFTEITYPFLDGFRNSLIKSGLKANSISN